MKTNFKKLAMAAGVTTALAGMSIPAHAIFVGDPGEAALIPLAVHSPNYLNTVVKITVPKSVGNDVISNFYTAPNSSPTNGTKAPGSPGSESPGAPALLAGTGVNEPSFNTAPASSFIHWYWLNAQSQHEVNGQFPVSQDDVAVFDWRAVDTGNVGLNRYGYLVFVTAAGDEGKAANFSFFTDAWLVIGNTPAANTKVSIPAIPLSDGPDGKSDAPTLDNNVVELTTAGGLVVKVSPLVSGNRTIWSDGKPNNYVFDLPLANSFGQAPGSSGSATVAVVWNDRNAGWKNNDPAQGPAGPWRSIPAFRFTNNEVKCSGRISLPDQLNVTFIGTSFAPPPPLRSPNTLAVPSATGSGALYEAWNKAFPPPPAPEGNSNRGSELQPGVWDNITPDPDPYGGASALDADDATYVASNRICTPPWNDGPNNSPLPSTNYPFSGSGPVFTAWNDAGLSGGFVKVVAPEPNDNNLQTVEGAAVYFTIPIFNNNWGTWSGWPLFLGDTLLGHPAGAFTTAVN